MPRQESIIGGTGALGSGLALRWAKAGCQVIIGSRDGPRAVVAAAELSAKAGVTITGMGNNEAAEAGDIVVLTVPFGNHQDTLELVKPYVAGKIVIDVTVPLMPPKVRTVQLPEAGSAAKASQIFLGEDVRVVSAFQNIAATHLADLDHDIDCEVFVCGNDPAARATVVGVAACLDAGVNDIGGTLMDESITRAAGSGHGQEMTPEAMEGMLVRVNRPSRQRTTLYADACDERRQQSMSSNIVLPPTRLAG